MTPEQILSDDQLPARIVPLAMIRPVHLQRRAYSFLIKRLPGDVGIFPFLHSATYHRPKRNIALMCPC